MTQEDLLDRIIESKLFERTSLQNGSIFSLIGTDYLFFPIDYTGAVWYRKFLRYGNRCTFEQVFNSVPTSIQEKLLFNLDLFK